MEIRPEWHVVGDQINFSALQKLNTQVEEPAVSLVVVLVVRERVCVCVVVGGWVGGLGCGEGLGDTTRGRADGSPAGRLRTPR